MKAGPMFYDDPRPSSTGPRLRPMVKSNRRGTDGHADQWWSNCPTTCWEISWRLRRRLQKNIETVFQVARQEEGALRKAALQAVAEQEAAGEGARKAAASMARELQQEGVTAFVDKAGRHWSLTRTIGHHGYPDHSPARPRYLPSLPRIRSTICIRL